MWINLDFKPLKWNIRLKPTIKWDQMIWKVALNPEAHIQFFIKNEPKIPRLWLMVMRPLLSEATKWLEISAA